MRNFACFFIPTYILSLQAATNISIPSAVSILITITFLLTNTNIGYGASSSKSLFKNKKVDYNKISSQQADILQKKQSVIKGDDAKELEAQDRAAKKILQANLGDISQIHIPQEMGRIVEVYQAPNSESQTPSPLIIGIQDLHTNPEAELNLAKILEILLKDYNMGLVCSEGADGVVDTSSISSFPDSRIKEKVSRIFVDSGELTGEEYLSITKYPDLPIWGVEDKDIYFKNILDFNKIMKFNPDSKRFISQTKKAIEELKPKIYSKELIELDKLELEFSSQKLDTSIYITYLTNYAKRLNLNTSNYKNIALLNETTQMEKTINQPKIMAESSNLILNLQSILMNENLKTDLDNLMARAKLFNDQKSSPFSFYSYLKDLALKHIKEDFKAKYPELNNFIDYLTKVNSLDSTKLFVELENLNFEIKETIVKTDEQKLLIKASRHINFLENFFNLKVSNEDLDYYLNNREEHKVAFFKSFLPETLKKYNINAFIDYNPLLIDSHLQELEEFYKTVKDRDIAMVNNSLSEITKRDAKLASLVHGGFHTKGITKLLREKGYSYIIVSPYSKTDMDEENYHFLLQGKRKPMTELLQKLDLSKIIDNLMNSPETLRINLGFDEDMEIALRDDIMPKLNQEWGTSETLESLKLRMAQAIITAGPDKVEKWNQLAATGLRSFEVRGLKGGSFIFKYTFSEGVEYIIITKNNAWMAKEEEIASFDSAPQIGKGFARRAVSPVPSDVGDEAVSAMTDTLVPIGLDYEVEVGMWSQVTIGSYILKNFLDPISDNIKMEGLVGDSRESLMGFMHEVFRVGAEQINNIDDKIRKISLKENLYDLFEKAGKKDITFYLAPKEVVGKGIYMRRVKIKGKDRYGVLINKTYFDDVSAVLTKIRASEKENVLPHGRRELMEKAVYYTVFERVMHELLEDESPLEKALALPATTGYEKKRDAIREAIHDIETNSFINTDAMLYAYLCHGKEMAGAIDLVRSLLKDGSESDRKLAGTIFGPNRYKKLEALFDRFRVGRDVLFQGRWKQAVWVWNFTGELTNCAIAFVNATYTGATTTAIADMMILANTPKAGEELKVENAFVIRADKMQQEQLNPTQWLAENKNTHLVILINRLSEYKAVADSIGNLEQIDERLHLVVLIGGNGLETREAAVEAGIDSKYLYNSTPGLQLLFTKAEDITVPAPINEVVGNRAQAEETVQQI